MSRKDLADKIGATRLQIQRVESNKYPAPLDLARAICTAIDLPLNTVFPGAAKVLATFEKQQAEGKRVDSDRYEKLREVGIEGDTRRHTLKVLLRGHSEPVFFSILAHEVNRIFDAVQDETESSSEVNFIVFDTDKLRVAINLKMTMFCHFLWDADWAIVSSAANTAIEDDDPRECVQIFFAENPAPTIINVEGEDEDDFENERNYVTHVFYRLDSGGTLEHERLHIVDEDGESAFLRAGDITLLTAPLWVLDPQEYDNVDDDDGDDESPPEPNAAGHRTHGPGKGRMTLVTVPCNEPQPD